MIEAVVIVAYCCFALGGLLLIGAFIRLFVWMCGSNKEKSKFNMRYWVNKPEDMKVVSAKSGKAMKGNLEGDDDSVHIEFDAIYAEASGGAVNQPIRELSETGELKPYTAKAALWHDIDPLYSMPIKPISTRATYGQPLRHVRPSLSYSEDVEYPVPPVPRKRDIDDSNDSELDSNKSARGSSINESIVSSEQRSAPTNSKEQLIATSGGSSAQKGPNNQSAQKTETKFCVQNEVIETNSTLVCNQHNDPENLETPLVENFTESDSEKTGNDSPFYDEITRSSKTSAEMCPRRLDSDTSSAFCEPRDTCSRKFSVDGEYARPIMAVPPSLPRK